MHLLHDIEQEQSAFSEGTPKTDEVREGDMGDVIDYLDKKEKEEEEPLSLNYTFFILFETTPYKTSL